MGRMATPTLTIGLWLPARNLLVRTCQSGAPARRSLSVAVVPSSQCQVSQSKKWSFQGRKPTRCCFNIYKPHEPEPSRQPCVLCGCVLIWFQLSCFPPQLQCVAPIHAETAARVSVKRTTLNASVLQATEGVSAMSVNTTPRSVVFMILTECISNLNSFAGFVWCNSKAQTTALWMMESLTAATWARRRRVLSASTGTHTSSWRMESIPSTPSRMKMDLARTTFAGLENDVTQAFHHRTTTRWCSRECFEWYRNPDGDKEPWCFYRKGRKLLWDYCDVIDCPEPTGWP